MDLSCYLYNMDTAAIYSRLQKGEGFGVRFLGRHKRSKMNFDGTNPPIVHNPPKTTTYGMKLLCGLNSMAANNLSLPPRQA